MIGKVCALFGANVVGRAGSDSLLDQAGYAGTTLDLAEADPVGAEQRRFLTNCLADRHSSGNRHRRNRGGDDLGLVDRLFIESRILRQALIGKFCERRW